MYQTAIAAALLASPGAAIVFMSPLAARPLITSILLPAEPAEVAVETNSSGPARESEPLLELRFCPMSDGPVEFDLWRNSTFRRSFDTYIVAVPFEEAADCMFSWQITPMSAPEHRSLSRERRHVETPVHEPASPCSITGWSDGTHCTIVPIPFLSWATDESTRFSFGLSHQQLGEETDVGVIGMLSMEF